MLVRWLSAGIGIPLFLGVVLWGRMAFGVFLVVIAFVALSECARAYWRGGIRANTALSALCLLLSAWMWLTHLPLAHQPLFVRHLDPTALTCSVLLVLMLILAGEVFHA